MKTFKIDREIAGIRYTKEHDVAWNFKCKSDKCLEKKIKEAATKLGWDPEFVVEFIKNNGDSFNSPTGEFGYQIDYDEDSVRLYMYTRDR